VVIDDTRFHVAYLGAHGQAVEHEVAQGVGVGDADVEQEVVRAGDVKQLDHLGHRERSGAERIDVRARMRADPYGDDCLQAAAEGVAIDVNERTATISVWSWIQLPFM